MTGSIRLYVADTLSPGGIVAATRGQAHYLATVMRRGPGATVLLFNGREGEFLARIETIGRDGAALRVQRSTRSQAPEPDLWLVFALLKRDATDLVVQKATELGVSALLPVITARSNTHRINADLLINVVRRMLIEEIQSCPRIFGKSRVFQPLDQLIVSAIVRPGWDER